MADETTKDMISPTEAARIMMGYLLAHGPAKEEEMRAVVDKVRSMRFDGAMADLVCNGMVQVTGLENGELAFKASSEEVYARLEAVSVDPEPEE